VGAASLGLALAFGLGGQRRAAELIEKWTQPRAEPEATTRAKSIF